MTVFVVHHVALWAPGKGIHHEQGLPWFILSLQVESHQRHENSLAVNRHIVEDVGVPQWNDWFVICDQFECVILKPLTCPCAPFLSERTLFQHHSGTVWHWSPDLAMDLQQDAAYSVAACIGRYNSHFLHIIITHHLC